MQGGREGRGSRRGGGRVARGGGGVNDAKSKSTSLYHVRERWGGDRATEPEGERERVYAYTERTLWLL